MTLTDTSALTLPCPITTTNCSQPNAEPARHRQYRRSGDVVAAYVATMAESGRAGDRGADKAARQAARELIAAYHQAELRTLLEHVRTGFDQLDAGTIDKFELDDLVHHSKRAANELWKFCGSSGGQLLHAANALAYRREQGDEPDWWTFGAPRRTRS